MGAFWSCGRVEKVTMADGENSVVSEILSDDDKVRPFLTDNVKTIETFAFMGWGGFTYISAPKDCDVALSTSNLIVANRRYESTPD
ncbi:MAG: hypothetical protein ACI4VK_01615 [Candidatus Coproplasma sp.]